MRTGGGRLAELRLHANQVGKTVDAELREHGDVGCECQFLYNGDLTYGRLWGTREAAVWLLKRSGENFRLSGGSKSSPETIRRCERRL